MKLNIEKIANRVFENARGQVIQEFGITSAPQSPSALIRESVAILNQRSVVRPQLLAYDNRQIFQAVVKAFGRNNLSWAAFMKIEPRIRKLLRGYAPTWVCDAVRSQELQAGSLRALLQCHRQDAEAVLVWAQRLSTDEGFYEERIRVTAEMMLNRDPTLSQPELALTVIGLLSNPPASHQTWKLHGMSYLVAGEFLRNLGWSAFTPDREVQRLLVSWKIVGHANVEDRVKHLQRLIGSDGPIPQRYQALLEEYLRFSLLGAAITPKACTFVETDNLLRMLAHYVEKDGQVSEENYFVE